MKHFFLRSAKLAVAAGWLAVFSSANAQPGLLFSITNRIWRFEQERNMDGTGWQTPEFSDADWHSGLGLFGFDSNPLLEPLIQTTLVPPNLPAPGLNAPRTYYFRTPFEYVHGDFTLPVLIFSNRVDDGAVFYLNGEEIQRIRMDDGPVTYATRANGVPPDGLGDATGWDVFTNLNPRLRWFPQVNWLAAEVHQVSGSGDIVFGCQVFLDAVPVEQVRPLQQTVPECDTFRIEFLYNQYLPAARYQWYKDGAPIFSFQNPTATNSTLVVTNMRRSDEGSYYVVMVRDLIQTQSHTATVAMLKDEGVPGFTSAMATSNLTQIRLTLSKPLLQASNLALAVITNVCGGPPLEILQVQEFNRTNVLLTTTERQPGHGYAFLLEEGQLTDLCGNPNHPVLLPISGLAPRLSWSAGSGNLISWEGCAILQLSTNLNAWADLPGMPASPYSVSATERAQFFRLRMP